MKLIYLCFDFMIDEEEAVPTKIVMYLDFLRRRNYQVVVSSKKCLQTVLDYNKDYPFMDYIISMNGAYLYDLNYDKVVYHKAMPFSTVRKLLSFPSENLYLFCHDFPYQVRGYFDQRIEDSIECHDISGFLEQNKKNIYQVIFSFSQRRDALKLIDQLQKEKLPISFRYEKEGKFYQIIIISSSVHVEASFDTLLKKKKLSRENVIFFDSIDQSFPFSGKCIFIRSHLNHLNKLQLDLSKLVKKEVSKN